MNLSVLIPSNAFMEGFDQCPSDAHLFQTLSEVSGLIPAASEDTQALIIYDGHFHLGYGVGSVTVMALSLIDGPLPNRPVTRERKVGIQIQINRTKITLHVTCD